jgi:hypothetical protein
LGEFEKGTMMSYEERKPGTGVLFTNTKKAEGKGPDWKGELKLERAYAAGETLKIAAWTKQSGRGPLISLKEDNWKPDPGYKQNVQPVPSKSVDDLDDDVPF